ncbi:MAG: hypothetical protein F6K58_10850 [Symploca sp. SIO2E9]|nr:hypothetical protein [Symploca sp. SIO2E9]
MSEKKSGEISKQTRRRGDAETRRIQVPRKISFTRVKVYLVCGLPSVIDFM